MISISNNFFRIITVKQGSVYEDSSINEIKQKFRSNKLKAIYLIDKEKKLLGVMSKGEAVLSDNQEPKWNMSPFYLTIGKNLSRTDIKKIGVYNSIPIINSKGNIIKILELSSDSNIEIADQSFNKYLNPLIIAEIGNNHNGSIESAKKLIDAALKTGVNAIKFQARSLEDLYIDLSDNYLNETDFSTSYTISELKKFNLSFSELEILFNYSRDLGLIVGCTPFDNESAKFLIEQKVNFIKIASADMSNYSLLNNFTSSNIPLIISTGMHNLDSIVKLNNWLSINFVEASLLHVNSTYPTPYSDINLKFMNTLESYSTTGLYGYSGHERGFHIPVAAISLGATIIEKHFTLNKDLEGNDHKVSLLPDEMSTMVSQIKDLSKALSGDSEVKRISQGEKLNKIALSKGVYMNVDLKPGDSFSVNETIFKSPCVGLTPDEIDFFDGKTITRQIFKNEPISKSYFQSEEAVHKFKNIKNWGLPVRFRDMNQIESKFNPNFLEYHMFSTDLNVNPNDHLSKLDNKTMSIHAPEQFKDGFILDLVSEDQRILKKSNEIFKKITDWVLSVKNITKQNKINLIVNVGGATTKENHINSFNKDIAFEKLALINELCKSNNINFLPQTMPPYPWHFGGQGFHRLFVDPDDLIKSQKWSEFKFCMDISHTFMSCSHLNIDFVNSIDKVSPYFDYMHVADAIYPGEEGINIGDGFIDFNKIKRYFNSNKIMWIPEVWNGHLDNFKGFEDALIKINQI